MWKRVEYPIPQIPRSRQALVDATMNSSPVAAQGVQERPLIRPLESLVVIEWNREPNNSAARRKSRVSVGGVASTRWPWGRGRVARGP